jgi:general stress protein YciG
MRADDDKREDDSPETPLDEPPPTPIADPPPEPVTVPYVVGRRATSLSSSGTKLPHSTRGDTVTTAVQKERRGFASMSREKQREIASKGGRAAHQKGTAHEWTSEEARSAGRKGGQISRGGRGRLVTPLDESGMAPAERMIGQVSGVSE